MKLAKTVAAARRLVLASSRPLVFVPTMGALHAGHAALVRRARSLAGPRGTVAVSIFVNPTQFGPTEDYSAYPRALAADRALCREQGADWIFAPAAGEMYEEDRSVTVEETVLSQRLCGRSRPGHFGGVCTVVAKLFAIVQPDAAIFGEKDWQQLAIIRRMARDLSMPVRIVGAPTVREPDGLAMSSRNAYLTPQERAVAPGIHAALRQAAREASPAAIVRTGRRLLQKIPGAVLDYLELVDAANLKPAAHLRRPARLAAAVFLGKARLIDNIAVPAIDGLAAKERREHKK